MELKIVGAQVLLDDGLVETPVHVGDLGDRKSMTA